MTFPCKAAAIAMALSALLPGAVAAEDITSPAFFGVQLGMDLSKARRVLRERDLETHERLNSPLMPGKLTIDAGGQVHEFSDTDLIGMEGYTRLEDGYPARGPNGNARVWLLNFAEADGPAKVYAMTFTNYLAAQSRPIAQMVDWLDERFDGQQPSCESSGTDIYRKYFLDASGKVLEDEELCAEYASSLLPSQAPREFPAMDKGAMKIISVQLSTSETAPEMVDKVSMRLVDLKLAKEGIDRKRVQLENDADPLRDM